MKRRLSLANVPTKITKAERLSQDLGVNIFIKRDDQTGTEISGNKIRKLEYALNEAIEKGCTRIITTGGLQSNHCRATAAAATMLGLKTTALLRVTDGTKVEGNYFLDKLFGAEVVFCTPEEYRNSRNEIMHNLAQERDKNGERCYVIPEGASFGIGSLGYFEAMQEIAAQEQKIGVRFDTVVVAVGSGGTYSGLYLANKHLNLGKRVIGFAVCDDSDYFAKRIDSINKEAIEHLGFDVESRVEEIEINDKYVGIGYALSRPEELEFIKYIATLEGLVLDPVYTGKAMYGLYNQIKKGEITGAKNILFIHTGGLFGLFPKQDMFNF
jgi:D-cysteine desulfhydrase